MEQQESFQATIKEFAEAQEASGQRTSDVEGLVVQTAVVLSFLDAMEAVVLVGQIGAHHIAVLYASAELVLD